MTTARRRLLAAAAMLACAGRVRAQAPAAGAVDERGRWIDAAFEMKRLAESWGDQPYGAVVVLDGRIVGEGPSRVVQLGDPDAHAERVALRDAQRRLGRQDLAGALLVSTSRPCRLCEQAAARAGVARMLHGRDAHDAGRPMP